MHVAAHTTATRGTATARNADIGFASVQRYLSDICSGPQRLKIQALRFPPATHILPSRASTATALPTTPCQQRPAQHRTCSFRNSTHIANDTESPMRPSRRCRMAARLPLSSAGARRWRARCWKLGGPPLSRPSEPQEGGTGGAAGSKVCVSPPPRRAAQGIMECKAQASLD